MSLKKQQKGLQPPKRILDPPRGTPDLLKEFSTPRGIHDSQRNFRPPKGIFFNQLHKQPQGVLEPKKQNSYKYSTHPRAKREPILREEKYYNFSLSFSL